MANINKAAYRQDYFERFSEEGIGSFAGRTFMPTKGGQAYLKLLTGASRGMLQFSKGVTRASTAMDSLANNSAIAMRIISMKLAEGNGLVNQFNRRITRFAKNSVKNFRSLAQSIAVATPKFSELAEGLRFGLENDTLFKRLQRRVVQTASITERAGAVMKKSLHAAFAPMRLLQTSRAASSIRDRMLGIPDLKMSLRQMVQVSKAATDIRNGMLGVERRSVAVTKRLQTLNTFVRTELSIGFNKLKRIAPFKFMIANVNGVSKALLFATRAQMAFNSAVLRVRGMFAGKGTGMREFLFGRKEQTGMIQSSKVVDGLSVV